MKSFAVCAAKALLPFAFLPTFATADPLINGRACVIPQEGRLEASELSRLDSQVLCCSVQWQKDKFTARIWPWHWKLVVRASHATFRRFTCEEQSEEGAGLDAGEVSVHVSLCNGFISLPAPSSFTSNLFT